MPEIKIKHVVSFSSEDKVHKAENLIKPETYRKWKCATPGEKSATVVLQFEKATQIHSIDIGNEGSAFVEVLVGRSSDSVSDFQVLLVASSFMSPLESRNGTHANRVRMFGSEKLSQNVKDEKWDCVQIVCTQPFNKTITYGLTFIKFLSPPEKTEEQPKYSEEKKSFAKLGAFKIKYEDDDDDSSELPVGSWFGKKTMGVSERTSSDINKDAPSYATAILKRHPENNTPKRKSEENTIVSHEPPMKKPTSNLNKDYITYKDVLDIKPESKKVTGMFGDLSKRASNSKTTESKKVIDLNEDLDKSALSSRTSGSTNIPTQNTSLLNKQSTSSTKQVGLKKKVPFHKIMEKVVIVLSGFVNPLRSDLRDKALEMGAKYKGDWDNSCTHLICAFINTPKYAQVNKLNGKIVSKDWIIDCYKKKELLPLKKYILGSSSSSSEEAEFTEESESDFTEDSDYNEEDYVDKRRKKKIKSNKMKTKTVNKKNLAKKDDSNTPSRKGQSSIINQQNVSDNSQSPRNVPSTSKDGSETEDEDALQDYIADTDVDSDSGGNTEDEIHKVEKQAERKGTRSPSKKVNGSKMNSELSEKPDIADLPLPELPNLFKQKHFFLYGDFTVSKQHDLKRYIAAYNGVLEDYMSDNIKYVITESKWDKNFEDALNENEDLIFVRSAWLYKCHESRKLMPYQPYIVIPNS